ncbi:MAG: pilus assembly protein CpaD, partial [Brevundimonas sp.]|nr:pilus assembly protein CpaD [Brevundimonas sp.]
MRNPVKRALASAVFVLAISGCASVSGSVDAPMTPLSRYSLQVEPGLDRIALAVHDQGLSSNQYAALRGLAARYGASGAGHVRIE